MRLAFFGDVVGRAGRKVVSDHLPRLRKQLSLDAVIINAENAAGGFGITAGTAEQLYEAGADVLTLGNHSFDQPQGMGLIERDGRILRPANYPAGTPGRGANLYDVNGYQMLVVSLHGRVFMDSLDDPFQAAERELAAAPLGEVADIVVVDMHAEATSEKNAMGYFCDGRASLVIGTHQHVPTADTRILPQGTAYQTDAGMCGDYNSIIGMELDEPMRRFTTRMRSARFEPATGPATLCGIFVETNAKGLAVRAEPIRVGGQLAEQVPDV
ncbi:metallophosphoesterase [Algimonas ampicilliniresistens]|uniref:Metallophosphoesterase n=1 Tax=Algimonas ampicilliniresistens TaxID=1298735 RepID=A0ABQ5VBK4_9PROT|nr:TIGR00282 family metallophosphoesterase [Algimonas ampicilliniresistens]GLQ24065.1 metallophosphoesterase [Algimonas ampicilliniresistens]